MILLINALATFTLLIGPNPYDTDEHIEPCHPVVIQSRVADAATPDFRLTLTTTLIITLFQVSTHESKY